MKVVIIQEILNHYREAFYDALLARMKDSNIDLTLCYGRARERASYAAFAWPAKYGMPFECRTIFGKLIWYPVLGKALRADLVITEHAAKALINYVLFVAQFLGGPKLVFWGHGRNHQTDKPNGLQERVKRFLGRHAWGYFAYTWRVRDELVEQGYNPRRVTDVQNSLEAPKRAPDLAELTAFRRELGLGADSIIGLFCSHMYPEKRLEMLVAVAKLVHEEIPRFSLVLAGAGGSQGIAEKAANEHDFIYFVGPVFGERKAACFAASRFVVFSGLLGLGIVDSFHHGVPPIVTDYPFHSPEIVYLVDGENGLLTADSVEGLAGGMIRLCLDDELYSKLVAGCKDWSSRLTVDGMADKFAEGILAVLRDED